MNAHAQKGFTVLELLIIIAVIAVLSSILVIVINPIETLKKSRDSQRISDLTIMKSAFGMLFITTSSPQIDGTTGIKNNKCIGGDSTKLWISVPQITTITDTSPAIEFPQSVTTWVQPASASVSGAVDGTGWIPVNFNGIIGGSPISNLPLDPINTVKNVSSVTNFDLIYRYACKIYPLSYEIDAKLESVEYTTNDIRGIKDGGNNAQLYEVGTDLTILPASNDF